jgi:ATP-dependent Clp protease, protease subunit
MADLNIYGPIGGYEEDSISVKSFTDMMTGVENDEDLDVFINSPGGSVWEGLGIYDRLVNHAGQVNIVIQGVAASIASIIAMAGDKITMAQSSRFMIHNPMGPSAIAFGTAEDLRDAAEDTIKTANLLDSIRDSLAGVYASRSGQSQKKILDWMGEETYFTAADAVKNGFADKVRANKKLAAFTHDQPVAEAIKDLESLTKLEEAASRLKIRNRQIPESRSSAKLNLAKCKLDELERSL